MLVVRAIQKQDSDSLMHLAMQVGDGMTTLKPDTAMLSNRIAVACDSFAEIIPPAQRDYLFVLEDTANGKIIGVSAIKSAVGLDEPFYNYRIGTLVHSSKELNVYSRMDTLYLSNDLTGCAELCSLFLHPDYRTGHNGKLLSKCRFLFIAQFPHLFGEKLIAELRGFQRPDGSSPFWDNLGRHFFKMDFSRADDLSSLGKKSFIAELMPRHPLYIAYLPEEAQQVIGAVHTATRPARHLLEQEGMCYEGFVDIFDAGPVLQARIKDVRAVRQSVLLKAAGVTAVASGASAKPAMVSSMVANTTIQNYRIIVSDGVPDRGEVQLTQEQMQALRCQPGEQVRVVSLNACR